MPELIIFIVLFTLGYFFGHYAESRHYASIAKREKQFSKMETTSSKYVIGDKTNIKKAYLVSGSVVISVDYFKRILAIFRNLFGGQVTTYETLLDRARREAILRLKESSPHADQIINLRIETSSIYKGAKQNSVGSIELLAYGTAIYFE